MLYILRSLSQIEKLNPKKKKKSVTVLSPHG